MVRLRQSLRVLLLLSFMSITACASYTKDSNDLMLGIVSQERLLAKKDVFRENYNDFVLNDSDRATVENWPSHLRIDIYFGSWCHDSEREVPQMLSILEGNNAVSFQLIAIDYNKTDPQQLAIAAGIKFTPTFVVFLGDKEIGRIVERPTKSLVDDITRFYTGAVKVVD